LRNGVPARADNEAASAYRRRIRTGADEIDPSLALGKACDCPIHLYHGAREARDRYDVEVIEELSDSRSAGARKFDILERLGSDAVISKFKGAAKKIS
jgi:hypothetical protein